MTADSIVKVPEMAESISEGTLKQWSKRKQQISGFGFLSNEYQRLGIMLNETRRLLRLKPTRLGESCMPSFQE